MVDRNIVNKLGLSQEAIDQQVGEMFSDKENQFLEEVLQKKVDSHLPGAILKGKIVSQIGNDVIVEVGLKSEGVVDASEFDSSDEIEPEKEIEVLLEDADSEGGLILLSKRKADRIRGWEMIVNTKSEGDVVTGKVVRRIKGGLLVDIGVAVFLPASQVDIRKPGDISRFIGKEVECKILKIDVEGRNIVVSRRKLIEEERQSSKEKILTEIELGQLRKGIVKNIADFGVFVDLGGVDGLLHISDLSWGRISHPSEIVRLDQEIECVVIGVDKKSEKISLGLKQKTSSPWEDVENRYPIGARVKGKVVNVMNYGVFVRLEDGIEGLVHISEMSWTKRLAHPGEMLNLGDEIEVIVLNVNREKQEISLGLKQTETNPWTIASQKYPAGTIVEATVRSLTNFGAFVEIEPGIDGMVHVSDLSWTKKYGHPSEALQRGQKTKCVVLDVDEEKRRVSLGIKQMAEDPWIHAIPEKYIPGQIIKGTVTKITNFGAFVELEPDLEGLLHISELADHKIDKPQDIVNMGEEIEVKILRVDTDSRKIGLSLRRVRWAAEDQEPQSEQKKTPAGVQTVLSDVDVDQITKPQEEESETEPKPEPEQPEAKQPESEQLEPEQPESEQPEPEQPEAKQPEPEQPEAKQLEPESELPQQPEDTQQAETKSEDSEEPEQAEKQQPDTEEKKQDDTASQNPAEESESSSEEPEQAEKQQPDTEEKKQDDTASQDPAEESESSSEEKPDN
ncbi:MAG: 30S ribosomal protein S1 [Planctomycetota bacterium]|jgi:small subunit ribosomal protein S1